LTRRNKKKIEARIYKPHQIFLDGEYLYLSDLYRVLVFSKTGKFVQQIGTRERTGEKRVGEWYSPSAFKINGEIYVADFENSRIQIFKC